ncbi:MAG: hypothetical protein IPK66_15350 [Rhodospirillales bacterium]|nr:hypothetical protein [Rhodospirillales bacterium]
MFVLLLAVLPASAQVTQHTTGWCSPNVAGTDGNVTIVCHGVDPKALARLEELLDKKDLELADKIKEANEWVSKYRELEAGLSSVGDDSKESGEAAELIKQGKFEEAGGILHQLIATQETQVAELARNHYNWAELYMLQFDPFSALPHYRKARQYAPDNAEYTFALAHALQRRTNSATPRRRTRRPSPFTASWPPPTPPPTSLMSPLP